MLLIYLALIFLSLIEGRWLCNKYSAFLCGAVVVFASAFFRVVTYDPLDDLHSYWQYYAEYQATGNLSFFSFGEVVLPFLFVLFKWFGITDLRIFLSIFYGLEVVLLLSLLSKYGKVGIIVFLTIIFSAPFCVYGGQLIRQVLSILIMMNAFSQKSAHRYLLFLLAVLTHLSALLYLVIFIPQFNKFVSRFGFILIALALLGPRITAADLVGLFQGTQISEKTDIWSTYEDDAASLTTFIMLYATVLFCALSRWQSKDSPERIALKALILYSGILGIVMGSVPLGALRFGLPAIVFAPIVLVACEPKDVGSHQLPVLGYSILYVAMTWGRILLKDSDAFEFKFRAIPFFNTLMF